MKYVHSIACWLIRFLCNRCLCSVSKIAGKGAGVVEHLIQFFYKRLDTQAVENNQVSCWNILMHNNLGRHNSNYMLSCCKA